MSVYFVFCMKNRPQKSELVSLYGTFILQELNKKFVPDFNFEKPCNYFYFLDDELSFKRIAASEENYTPDKKAVSEFQTEVNEKFLAVLKWCREELKADNSIFLIRQIETDNRTEYLQFNTVYASKSLKLDDLFNASDSIEFDFNIAYELSD